MKPRTGVAGATIIFFFLAIVSGSYPLLGSPAAVDADETARLVREADEAYQNGNFRLAIEKYQKAMRLIGEKKELAQTKQELFQTMTSLALTYFTIQENEQAEKQLQDLIRINPNYELDPEFFPPKFIDVFRAVQRGLLGRLAVTTVPAGARVSLGSQALGAAPIAAVKVLAGSHEVRAELEGYAPAVREVTVQAGAETAVEIPLQARQTVIEKKEPPPAPARKKKRLSPLVIVGGAVLAAAAIALLAGKKEAVPDKPELRSKGFSNSQSVPIDVLTPTYMPLNVEGVPAKIEKIEYRVVVNHPGHMEDLTINIVGTDNRTLFNIWNRGQAGSAPFTISGSSEAFNSVPANGTWRLLVQNPGRSPGGELREFTLRIFYLQ